MVQNQDVAQGAGWFGTIKEKSASLFDKIRDSKESIIDVALYAGLGFLLGYLVKRFSSYLIMIAIFIVIIVALQQFEVIFVAVNWAKIQSALGMQPVATADASFLSSCWEWMKANVLISVSFIIGFLLGLKFGA
jgi:uncharacterized membrane protein (Fun14 family)